LHTLPDFQGFDDLLLSNLSLTYKPGGTMTTRLLNTFQVAQLLNCTERKLESDRIKGGGIRYVKIGKCVRYDLRDIENYIIANTVNSTSQPRGL